MDFNEKTYQISHENIREFQSIGDLQKWLISRDIDLTLWGKGSAKDLDHLWGEIVKGECLLQDHPPLRIVTAVQVLIYNRGSILIELEQELMDNRIRKRNFRPSEKIKPGENYRDVAIRCIHKELSVPYNDIEILDKTYLHVISETPTHSYPQLRTRYTFHVIEAKVANLPDDPDFWTNELPFNKNEIVKRHHWIWN